MAAAASHGRSAAFLRALVEAGADPNERHLVGGTPLICAVMQTSHYPAVDAEALKYLLSLAETQVNARSSALHCAKRWSYWKARVAVRLGASSSKTKFAAFGQGR